MTDYSKWKVTELKAEVKNRKIPLTGLKLKQNYIDKLVESDAAERPSSGLAAQPAARAEAATASATFQEAGRPIATETVTEIVREAIGEAVGETVGEIVRETVPEEKKGIVQDSDPPTIQPAPPSTSSAETRPQSHLDIQQPRPEESQPLARGAIADGSKLVAPSPPAAVIDSKEALSKQDEASVDAPLPLPTPHPDQPAAPPLTHGDHVEMPTSIEATAPSPTLLSQTVVSPGLEQNKKRKRGSESPPPPAAAAAAAAELGQKKAKTSDGGAIVEVGDDSAMDEMPQPASHMDGIVNGHGSSHQAANGPLELPVESTSLAEVEQLPSELQAEPASLAKVEQVPSELQAESASLTEVEQVSSEIQAEPMSSAKAEQTHSPEGPARDSPSEPPVGRSPAHDQNKNSSHAVQEKHRVDLKSPTALTMHSSDLFRRPSPPPSKPAMDADRHVAPALHPATTCLYLRNFKRPLNYNSLQTHISALAAAPDDGHGDEKPVASLYLDGIRTHAFVALTSISAASRVRSAMHDCRFPDEKTREPLWVDFIPEDKVQTWTETEQRTAGDGRLGRRWEVVYEQTALGVEATLQEVGISAGGGGGHIARTPTSPAQPSTRVLEAASKETSTAAPPVVHPDRSRSVQQDGPKDGKASSSTSIQPDTRPSTGFQALDDLFPSTKSTKPKLYYKPITSPAIIEDRLDLIRDLHHIPGAKTGDPDMKRYSFAVVRGRDEWVDKGPEYGHSKGGRGGDRGGGGGSRFYGPNRGGRGGRGGRGRGDGWKSGGGRYR